ncbi:uncharacterized protein METZ01_LOCUS388589, partial [marine metagenome]
MNSYQEKFLPFGLFFPVTRGIALQLRQNSSRYQSYKNSQGLGRGQAGYKAPLSPIPTGYFQ